MIRFERHSVHFGEVWFDEPVAVPQPDVLVVRHSRIRPNGDGYTVKLSLVTDLTSEEEVIWNGLHTDCRRQIRRAQAAGLQLAEAHRPTDENEILEFVDFYNRFAAVKGISGISVSYLHTIAAEGRLWLSSVSSESETLARHSCIATGSTVRALYGAAIFRSVNPELQRAISGAHRQLHWMDVVRYKAAGFETYDWGGLFADEAIAGSKGVNDFKRQFGGRPIEYFESEQALTLRGWLYLRLRPGLLVARSAVRRSLAKLRAPVPPRAAGETHEAAPLQPSGDEPLAVAVKRVRAT